MVPGKMVECKKRLVCILVLSYGMAGYGLHTSPLSGRAGRPLVSAASYGIHILAIYQSISGSARPYINPRWAASPSTFINTPRYIAPRTQHLLRPRLDQNLPLCPTHQKLSWEMLMDYKDVFRTLSQQFCRLNGSNQHF